MTIQYCPNSGIRTYRGDGTAVIQCVLLCDETPTAERLELTGADVEGLSPGDIICAGSSMIAPKANYIALTDGVLTRKE